MDALVLGASKNVNSDGNGIKDAKVAALWITVSKMSLTRWWCGIG